MKQKFFCTTGFIIVVLLAFTAIPVMRFGHVLLANRSSRRTEWIWRSFPDQSSFAVEDGLAVEICPNDEPRA